MERAATPADAEFEEQKKGRLIDLNLSDSTELWLLEWPINQSPEFDGQEVTLNLQNNGELGSFQGSSGKSYDMLSYKFHDPEEMVFLSSPSESKIVGKISRRVSLVHYPEPDEFQKQDKVAARIMAQRNSATSLTNSSRRTPAPTQTIRGKSHQLLRSTISKSVDRSKSPKRRRVREPTSSIGGQSDRDSGREQSGVSSLG